MGYRLQIVAILAALFAAACRAPAPESELALQWGTFGVGDTEQLFVVGAEYRAAPIWEGLRPIAGLAELEDGAEYFYAGVRYDVDLGERWQLSPSFAPGIYLGESLDLGGPVEFRSGVDLAYRFHDRWKAAAGIYHLSNGGLYSRNGGSEVALFTLAYVF